MVKNLQVNETINNFTMYCIFIGRIGRDCFEILHTNLFDKKCSCSGVYTVKPLKDLPPFKVIHNTDI